MSGGLLAVLLVLAPAATGQEDETLRISGTGTWGTDADPQAANATWLLADGEVIAYHIERDDGTRASCSTGNGTLSTPTGTGHVGACHGEASGNATILILETQDDGGNATVWTGRFEAQTQGPVGAGASPEGLSPVLAVLGIGGAIAIGAIVTLSLLFARERRLTGHLARRLWQKSRGESASKRPESLGEERVKRILVRSKN